MARQNPRPKNIVPTTSVFDHWKTTILGAVGATLLYWQTTNFKFPETKQEFVSLAGSVVLLLMGYSAADK